MGRSEKQSVHITSSVRVGRGTNGSKIIVTSPDVFSGTPELSSLDELSITMQD